MKSNILSLGVRMLLTVALCLSSNSTSFACTSIAEASNSFNIYKLHKGGVNPLDEAEIRNRNIALWMKQTGSSMNFSVLYNIIYRSSDFDEKMLEQYFGDNPDAMDVIVQAHKCEDARLMMSSQWYFPVEGDDAQTTLTDVAEHCMSRSMTEGKMQGRYIVQAVRALFALKRYADCVLYWEQMDDSLADDVLRDIALPYVAGCYYHIHQPDKAMPIYVRHGDVESIKFCLKHPNFEKQDYWYTYGFTQEEHGDDDIFDFEDGFKHDYNLVILTAYYCPDAPNLENTLNQYLSHIDNWGANHQPRDYWDNMNYSESELKAMYLASQKGAEKASGYNRCLWYYTTAVLGDALDCPWEARHWLEKASRCVMTQKMSEYIRVLDAYLYLRNAEINNSYMARVEKEVRWLDAKLRQSMTCEYNTWYSPFSDQSSENNVFFSDNDTYYWNMTLRRLVLTDICSRLLSEGKVQDALRLANFAENRYYRLCDNKLFVFPKNADDLNTAWNVCCNTISDYRYNYVTGFWENLVTEEKGQEIFDFSSLHRSKMYFSNDYSNELFNMADHLKSEHLYKYIQWMQQPHSGFDALLASGSNLDMDFWYEIYGTHCIREFRFANAVRALEKVSIEYQNAMNLVKEDCILRDPFNYEYQYSSRVETTDNYKLNFARIMLQCEQAFNAADPNIAADNMLTYAIGLHTATNYCWALTAYSHGWTFRESDYDFVADFASVSQKYRAMALQHYDNDESRVHALRRLCLFDEIATNYTHTEAGKYILSQCDNWKDYVINSSYSGLNRYQ